MRTSFAALAIIRRRQSGTPQWLVQWNEGWQCLALIGGHKHTDESFRECIVREVMEELHLENNTNFRAAAEPLAHLEYTAWSARAQAETAYAVELFAVELIGSGAEQHVAADPDNRWITAEEIAAGRTADGKSISDTLEWFRPYLM